MKFNIPCENVKYVFTDSEVDVLSLNKNDYTTEFEVKISRSDFKADAKKKKWKWYVLKHKKRCPNYFYYVCPSGLISIDEIADYSGLIYYNGEQLEVIKKASMIHNGKSDRTKLLTKFCRVMSERLYLGSCRMTFEGYKRKNKFKI